MAHEWQKVSAMDQQHLGNEAGPHKTSVLEPAIIEDHVATNYVKS